VIASGPLFAIAKRGLNLSGIKDLSRIPHIKPGGTEEERQ